jgi:dihydropteroate synthase
MRMGHQTPTYVLSQQQWPMACKFMDVPHEVATYLMQWLQQLRLQGWWHSTAGATAATVDVLVGTDMASLTALRQTAPQTPLLEPVLTALDDALQRYREGPVDVRLGRTAVGLRQRPAVMGVLNVTPDSFSDGGFYLQPEQALKHAEEMLTQGADLVDVGGASSRPGATPVPAAVEQRRVIPVVREIVKRFGARVSVDTYQADVAAAALDVGAVMINDISALRFDPGMAEVLARHGATVVLMHMQGTPQTMQQAPQYRHVIDDVYTFLAARLDYARQRGIARECMVCDPGIGFGKTLQHNLELLRDLQQFQALGQPILVGTSRKSFLGELLQREVWDRLEGTLASVVYAVLHGASIVRVHDVGPTVQAVRLIEAITTQPARPSSMFITPP